MSITLQSQLKAWLLPGLILGYLWFVLINHLRIEWEVNPQYSYGWAVPFLCAYLIYLRRQESGVRSQESRGRIQNSEFKNHHCAAPVALSEPQTSACGSSPSALDAVPQSALPPSPPRPGRGNEGEVSPSPHQQLRNPQSAIRISSLVSHPSSLILFYSLALVWLPIRLIQEANPEWRLVSWALALDVVGLTLLVIQISEIRSQRTELISDLCRLSAAFTFPLFFFLVAVPWPTIIEGPLIQALTRANAAVTIELLNLLGIPAIQHGNLIEVGSGMVGIDEACSGIRSFQATLMISLFFGDLYRLSVLRRLSLCLSGFALSFVFNVGRTSLLTYVASRDGIEAIAKWHDPAGVTILVLCFLSLWLLALALRQPALECGGSSSARLRTGERTVPSAEPGEVNLLPDAPTRRFADSPVPRIIPWLALWLLFSGIAVEGWYRGHERQIPGAAKWTVAWPTNTPSYQPIPFSEKTRQFLRHDEGANASWNETDGTRWQMIFLRWNPGKIAVHLAKSHTPQACLPASGRKLNSVSGLQTIRIGQLPLPFRHYVASDAGRPLHVFYCLWEDRTADQSFAATGLTWWNRFEPVLAGRRNLGQRSVELAVWGIDDPAQAEAAVRVQLEKVIRPGPPTP